MNANTLVINGTGHRNCADGHYLKHSPKQIDNGKSMMLTYFGNHWWQRVHHATTARLWELRKDNTYDHMVVISGLALGYDQLLVQCCLEVNNRLAEAKALNIEPIIIVGAVPFEGQDGRWFKESKQQYKRLLNVLDYSYETDVLMHVEDKPFGVKLNLRNQWMVDVNDVEFFGLDKKKDAVAKHICLAAFDGRKGGTANCLQYALKKGVQTMIYNPLLEEWMMHDEFKLLREPTKKVQKPQTNGVVTNTDLFTTKAQAVVNPVNCKGILGKGLAKQFKERTAHTTYEADYKAACKSGELVMGKPYVWNGGKRTIISLPTKNHWSSKSKLEEVRESLVTIYKENAWGLKSIAFPAIGCGLGGLNWEQDVKPMMLKFAASMKRKGVTITIHEPTNQAQF